MVPAASPAVAAVACVVALDPAAVPAVVLAEAAVACVVAEPAAVLAVAVVRLDRTDPRVNLPLPRHNRSRCLGSIRRALQRPKMTASHH